MKPYKPDQEKWNSFSKAAQMQHIAAELARASKAASRGQEEWRKGAFERAITLIDATLRDSKWQDGVPNLYKLRDAVAELYISGNGAATSRFLYSQLLEQAAEA